MQASDIDWSKAPEWATGYGFIRATGDDVWVSDDCYTYVDGQQGGRVFSIKHGEGWALGEICVAYSRPSAWSGTGLPPAGTVCEGRGRLDGEWREVVVLAHRIGRAVVSFTDHERLQWCEADELRPIRTAEQIAVDAELEEIARLYAEGGPYARLRVDPDQTSFWEGLQYRTFREISIASGTTAVFKVVVPVDTVLYDVSLTLDAGAIRLRTVSGGTEGGTFSTPLPILRKNTMTDAPNIPAQNAITTGGTHTDGTDIDVIRLVVAGATAQQSSIGSKAYDQRGVGPGTYYWKLENISNSTATGVFSAFWEERQLPY